MIWHTFPEVTSGGVCQFHDDGWKICVVITKRDLTLTSGNFLVTPAPDYDSLDVPWRVNHSDNLFTSKITFIPDDGVSTGMIQDTGPPFTKVTQLAS